MILIKGNMGSGRLSELVRRLNTVNDATFISDEVFTEEDFKSLGYRPVSKLNKEIFCISKLSKEKILTLLTESKSKNIFIYMSNLNQLEDFDYLHIFEDAGYNIVLSTHLHIMHTIVLKVYDIKKIK